jgi:MOSC domain-containing protein YiiM
MSKIVSIQVGQVLAYEHASTADGKRREWQTAFFKAPVSGSVQVGEMGVAGDEQADRENHGGLDKAVLAYSANHYDYWRQHLQLSDMPYGAFGENLTVEGSEESNVCIGDRWQAGQVIFEVSQPRQPCWKMGRRWNIVDLPKQVIANGRSGWYLRVVQPGEVTAGMTIELISRPRPTWTIARASRLLYHEPDNIAGLEDLAAVAELSRAWREELLDRVARRSNAGR